MSHSNDGDDTMATDLGRMMPGYDFLQSLMKNAGAALPGLPGMSQWIAPTLDPAELDKRIQELKTVQFWLEQNARLLATTIQALEVQRMTLATLQTMNLPLADLRDALKVSIPPPAPAPAAAGDSDGDEEDEDEDEDEGSADAAAGQAAAAPGVSAAAAAAPPAIDPLQWWGALTQQFTQLAAQAVQDSAADASRSGAPAPVAVRPSTGTRKAVAPATAPAPPAAPSPAPRKRGR